MDARAYALPALAMALLTFVVWLRLFQTRIGQMKRERIHPQSVALSAQAVTRLSDSRAADNFRNLFELPVLFYAALGFAMVLGLQSTALVVLAWGFMAARMAHSAIQCTYNKVMHRFRAYVVGGALLWAMWGVLGWHVFSA